MSVTIKEHDITKVDEIIAALQEWWDYEPYSTGDDLYLSGDGFLTGGLMEEEYAQQVAEKVWDINGSWCYVEVAATYLENLPYEIYCFEDEEYQEYLQKKRVKHE